ncbi:MAG: LTA synthase family protein [Alphaproteobacteria bacterium]
MQPAVLLHIAAGAALVLAAWLAPRRIARAGIAPIGVMLLDAAPFALGAALLAVATGRPLFVGVVVAALGAGFCLADHTMRETLREPVVFSEAVELPQLFTHPHLYLPFAGPVLVLGGALTALSAAVGLLIFEPPVSQPRPLVALAAVALIAAGLGVASREQPVAIAARILRRIARPSGEPVADAAALGPFAMLIVHAVIARAERSLRRRQFAVGCASPQPYPCESVAKAADRKSRHTDPDYVASRLSAGPRHAKTGRAGTPVPADPIIIVQCESFFDARRLSPAIPPELLAGFAACCASSARYGRLAVPGWGANTMRAEFAVLTGIPETELGYDRFNPYYALARAPLESHVRRLRRAGYRTICLHPFDRRFFRRDLAMPALGFERFLGRETLGGSRTPPYYPDPDLARDILRIVDREGPRTFVFAITMGNHGPWLAKGPPIDPDIAALFDPSDIPDGAGLLRYLDGMKRSDMMLQILIGELERRGRPAVAAFYGDHLPSLPRAFAHFGFAETSADYVIWNGGGAAERRDIPAHQLGQAAIAAALAVPPSGAHESGQSAAVWESWPNPAPAGLVPNYKRAID